MPNGEIRNLRDLEDFVRGVTLFGTGGGGDPERGKNILMKDLELNKRLEWKDIDEIEGKWSICTFGMGTIAPETEEIRNRKKELGLKEESIENPLLKAAEELERYLNKDVDVIVPIELGGGNTTRPMDVAIKMGKVYVDGDYAGRAIPEIVQTTPHIFGKKVFPIVAVDYYGDITIIKNAVNNNIAERLGKLISESAYGAAGEAGIIISVKELKQIIIRDSLTTAFNVGKTIRKAREEGRDPVEALINEIDGYLLFKGELIKKEWKSREGYMIGTNTFRGIDKFKDKEFKIWFKNENHISWMNNEPYATSPDLIIVVRTKDGEPLTNTIISEGEKVSIIGKKSNEIFRKNEGLKVLGPKHFGFEYNYTPIEKLMEN